MLHFRQSDWKKLVRGATILNITICTLIVVLADVCKDTSYLYVFVVKSVIITKSPGRTASSEFFRHNANRHFCVESSTYMFLSAIPFSVAV